jgi:predicted GNAT superfamily acetyltransferase
MILDLATLSASTAETAQVEVRHITDPGDLDEVVAIKNAVWQTDDDWIQHMLAEEMHAAPENIKVYVAYADGVPASTAWLRFTPRSLFASLWGGSTLPAYRKRGLYTALLTRRLWDAQERGVRYVTIDASPMSQPIVERHGFRLASYTTPYLLRKH